MVASFNQLRHRLLSTNLRLHTGVIRLECTSVTHGSDSIYVCEHSTSPAKTQKQNPNLKRDTRMRAHSDILSAVCISLQNRISSG